MGARAHHPFSDAAAGSAAAAAQPHVDHYARLGIPSTAALPDVRRAFRLLALRHHPDRAGPESTEVFQSLAEAYATLSNPTARARYDERLRALGQQRAGSERRQSAAADDRTAHGEAGVPEYEAGEFSGWGGKIGWRRQRSGDAGADHASGMNVTLLPRLSGSLEALFAAGIARRLPDGVVELCLLPHEAAAGGIAAIDAAVPVACPTCAGIADAGVLWCRRCEFAGAVIDQVTFTLRVPPAARDGLTFSFETDPSHQHPPLRIRIRHQEMLPRP